MPNIFPYVNPVHQPECHYQPRFYYPQNNSSDGSHSISSCTITSPAQAAQNSHQDNEAQLNKSTLDEEAQSSLNVTNYAAGSLLQHSSHTDQIMRD